MVNAHHRHLLTQQRFKQTGQFKASFGRHATAWGVAAFLALVAILVSLFEWLQVLPEQAIMGVNAPVSSDPPDQAIWQVSQKNLPDPFLEQKKMARQANLPDQF